MRAHVDKLKQHARVAADSARLIGVLPTVRRGLELLLRERPHRDLRFDARHGTDTSGSVPPSQLGISDPTARAQAVLYLPSPARVTRRLLDALDIDPAQWSFIDFGAGKGRVVLVAAERPFREVIGVELSADLQRVALDNLRRYRGPADVRRIRVELGDARAFTFPPGDLVLHFYHPFGPPILREVLRGLERAMQEQPRRVRIVYLGAFTDAMLTFAAFRLLKQRSFETCLEPKYSWALFENA